MAREAIGTILAPDSSDAGGGASPAGSIAQPILGVPNRPRQRSSIRLKNLKGGTNQSDRMISRAARRKKRRPGAPNASLATSDEDPEDAEDSEVELEHARKREDRKKRKERKEALHWLATTAEGGIVVDPVEVAGPSKDSTSNREKKLLRRYKKAARSGRVIPGATDGMVAAAQMMNDGKAARRCAKEARELRKVTNANNRYRLFASMEWQASWLQEMTRYTGDRKVANGSGKCYVRFGKCAECHEKITNGQLFMIKFEPLTIKQSLLKSKGADSVALFFKTSTTHLACETEGSMTHLVRRSLDSTLTTARNFYVHPNVEDSGWVAFMEKYAAVLAANNIPTGSLHLDPPFWTLGSRSPTRGAAHSPPQIFWDWEKAIDRGEVFHFSHKLEPGDAGKTFSSSLSPRATMQRHVTPPFVAHYSPEASSAECSSPEPSSIESFSSKVASKANTRPNLGSGSSSSSSDTIEYFSD